MSVSKFGTLQNVVSKPINLTNKLSKSGDTMTGDLNMNGNSIENIGDPQSETNVVSKGYVTRNLVSKYGDVMTGDLNMNGNSIENIGDPQSETNVVSKLSNSQVW